MPQIFAIILISRKTANPNSTGQLYYCEKSVNNAFKVVTKPALLLTIDFCTDVLLSHQPICLMLFSLKVSVSRSFNTIFCLLLLSDFKAVDKLLAIWYFFQSFCFFFWEDLHWSLVSPVSTYNFDPFTCREPVVKNEILMVLRGLFLSSGEFLTKKLHPNMQFRQANQNVCAVGRRK